MEDSVDLQMVDMYDKGVLGIIFAGLPIVRNASTLEK
jgi:hypothetical protein